MEAWVASLAKYIDSPSLTGHNYKYSTTYKNRKVYMKSYTYQNRYIGLTTGNYDDIANSRIEVKLQYPISGNSVVYLPMAAITLDAPQNPLSGGTGAGDPVLTNFDKTIVAGDQAYPKGSFMNVRTGPGKTAISRVVNSPNSGGKLTGAFARDTEGYKWYLLQPAGYVREDVFTKTKPSEVKAPSYTPTDENSGEVKEEEKSKAYAAKDKEDRRKKTWTIVGLVGGGIALFVGVYFIVKAINKRKK